MIVRKAIYAPFFTIDYASKNVEGICVKRIGLILMAIVVIAFLMPVHGMAQQATQTVTVNGCVYSGALPIENAKVQLYSWDGKKIGDLLKTTTTSDGTNGPKGSFSFNIVLTSMYYDPGRAFNYAIKAVKNDGTAYALVHIVPPEAVGQKIIAEPIYLDLAMDSWVTDLTGTVQSGNLLANAIGVPNANVTIYERNQTTGEPLPTAKTATVTGANGKFEVTDLPYGLYQAQVTALVNNKNYIEKVNFTVYQQETHIDVIMSGIILTTATPAPSGKPTAGGGGGFFGIPGFEVVLALAALSGAALYLKKR